MVHHSLCSYWLLERSWPFAGFTVIKTQILCQFDVLTISVHLKSINHLINKLIELQVQIGYVVI